MIRRTVWSIVMVMLACSAGTAADIRRVVTGLDSNNKAVALFDSRLTLSPGKSGIPAANLWITTTARPSRSVCHRRTTARLSAWSNFRRSTLPRRRRWIPLS